MSTTTTTAIAVRELGIARNELTWTREPSKLHAIGRCADDRHGAFAWKRTSGIAAADLRCPSCGGPLGQTTRMLRAGFRVLADEQRNAIAAAGLAIRHAEAAGRLAAFSADLAVMRAEHAEAWELTGRPARLAFAIESAAKDVARFERLAKRLRVELAPVPAVTANRAELAELLARRLAEVAAEERDSAARREAELADGRFPNIRDWTERERDKALAKAEAAEAALAALTASHDHLNDTTYISERFSECTRCGALIDWHDDEDAEPGMPEDGSAEFSANELRIAAALYRVAAARKAEREELVAEGNLPAAAMAGKDERQARRDATIMDGSLLEELRDRVDRLLVSRAFGAAAQVEEQLRGALARRRELLAELTASHDHLEWRRAHGAALAADVMRAEDARRR